MPQNAFFLGDVTGLSWVSGDCKIFQPTHSSDLVCFWDLLGRLWFAFWGLRSHRLGRQYATFSPLSSSYKGRWQGVYSLLHVLVGPEWNWRVQGSWLVGNLVQGWERIPSPADQSCHYFSTFLGPRPYAKCFIAKFIVSCNSHNSSVRQVLAIPSSRRGDWKVREGIHSHARELSRPAWTHNH